MTFPSDVVALHIMLVNGNDERSLGTYDLECGTFSYELLSPLEISEKLCCVSGPIFQIQQQKETRSLCGCLPLMLPETIFCLFVTRDAAGEKFSCAGRDCMLQETMGQEIGGYLP